MCCRRTAEAIEEEIKASEFEPTIASEYTSSSQLQSDIRNNRFSQRVLRDKYAAPLTAAQEVSWGHTLTGSSQSVADVLGSLTSRLVRCPVAVGGGGGGGGRCNAAVNNKQIGWPAREAEPPKTKGKKMCAETIFAGELIKNGIYY